MNRILASAAAVALCFGQSAIAAEWQGHAGNPQHTAQAPATSQALSHIHWSTPIDTDAQVFSGDIYAHYGSAIITTKNTVLLPVKTSDTGSESSGNFRIEAHNAKTGALIWEQTTDYIAPPHSWVPMFGPQLTPAGRLFYPGAGGTVFSRNPNVATGTPTRHAFYGLALYEKNEAEANANVFIDTPINSDAAGNVYFGFTVTGAAPAKLASGIARISSTGKGAWIRAAATIGGSGQTKVQTNSAPAVSNDGSTIYITVRDDGNGGAGYLVGLDSTTLQPKYKAALKDPVSGDNSWVDDDSSATPTVGPDGDVYIGVLEAPFLEHNDRGWLLHFDSTLQTQKATGSFGWDDTVSTVPASAVPSYTGTSSYLIISKYNNYADFGLGDGENKLAVLDPNATQPDKYTYQGNPMATVMKEVLTVLGPTSNSAENLPGVREWCISSAAVDPSSNSVLVNSEDGHAYRWNLKTNTLSQALDLNPPRGEAYTQTVVGVDGTVYAVNNAIFYAIGK